MRSAALVPFVLLAPLAVALPYPQEGLLGLNFGNDDNGSADTERASLIEENRSPTRSEGSNSGGDFDTDLNEVVATEEDGIPRTRGERSTTSGDPLGDSDTATEGAFLGVPADEVAEDASFVTEETDNGLPEDGANADFASDTESIGEVNFLGDGLTGDPEASLVSGSLSTDPIDTTGDGLTGDPEASLVSGSLSTDPIDTTGDGLTGDPEASLVSGSLSTDPIDTTGDGLTGDPEASLVSGSLSTDPIDTTGDDFDNTITRTEDGFHESASVNIYDDTGKAVVKVLVHPDKLMEVANIDIKNLCQIQALQSPSQFPG